MPPLVRAFLEKLARFEESVPRSEIGSAADRAEDRARQWARRRGYCRYRGRWLITDAGRAALTNDAQKCGA